MKNNDLIRGNFTEAQKVLNDFLQSEQNFKNIEDAGLLMIACLKGGGKIISCGNGGSMCDAMHFAEELTGRFRNDRKPMAAVAISDASYLTCVANDYGFNSVFSRFVEAFGKKDDVLLAISTSGNSENIIAAADASKKCGMKVVALTGKTGGKLAGNCDVEIRAPHSEYADRAQEIHIKVIHSLIHLIEAEMN